MSDGSDRRAKGGLKRREFLSVGALPLAAALGAADLSLERPRRPRTAQDTVRIGIIGAGANVRRVMLPGLQSIAGYEVLAVANRSLQSSQRVADEFDIPRAYSNWRELMDDDELDAVLIGTWPYMHRTLTLAALEKGKHVLCQARMANTGAEAREMLEASLRHPDLVCQLVPTSTSYRLDNVLKRLINEGHVGEVLSVDLQRLQRSADPSRRMPGDRTGPGGFADFGGDMLWRHNWQFSGHNSLNIGSTYESMMRWFGRGDRIMAMTKVHVPYRNINGQPIGVTMPDHVDILYELANGAQVHMRYSSTTGLSNGNQTWIYGTEGTIHIDSRSTIFAGRRGDSELSEVPNPPEHQAHYRVEEEFINAIRGIEEVTMAPFDVGVHYMEFVEGVNRSAQAGEAVYLPL